MQFQSKPSLRLRIQVSPGAIFLLTLVWILTSGRFLLLLLGAAALHEGGHLIACWLCGIPVRGFSVTICGAELRLEGEISPAKQLITALAGPAASLAAALIAVAGFPEAEETALFAGLNLVAGAFNLLPVEPLDGGRALVALCGLLRLGEETVRALEVVTTVLLVLGLLPGLLLAVRGNGSLLFMLLWLLSGRLGRDFRKT